MNPIFATLFSVLCVREALAAVALGKAQEHPNHPGQCYDPSTNVVKTVGANWPLKNGCGRVMCEKMGSSLYFSYSTCPSVGAAPPCTIVSGDHQASYPECCPRVKCPEENEVDYVEHGDQMMMASHPGVVATYDVTIDDDHQNEDYEEYFDKAGFSNVFPLWRDIRDGPKLGIDDEEKPYLYSPRK